MKNLISKILSIFSLFLLSGSKAFAITLESPIYYRSFIDIAFRITEYIFGIGITIAGIFIVYAGFLFIAAQGNEEKIKKAKSTITWAIVGLIVFIAAYGLAYTFETFIKTL